VAPRAAAAQFVEMGLDLAKEKKIRNGDTVEVSSARGKIEAVAVVTPRFRPSRWPAPRSTGWVSPGASAGSRRGWRLRQPADADGGDANTMIPETKAFMVNITAKG